MRCVFSFISNMQGNKELFHLILIIIFYIPIIFGFVSFFEFLNLLKKLVFFFLL